MQKYAEFKEAINTLLYSWGGDTPEEVVWGLNELMQWVEKEYDIQLEGCFFSPFEEGFIDNDVVLDELEAKLTSGNNE